MIRRTGSRAATLPLALDALAVLFGLAFLVVVMLRIGYPYELEWIEGGSLAMVRRVLDGQPPYVAPSLEYVPFNYPPLYYWIGAMSSRLLGDGFLALRLVSLAATLGAAALIARFVAIDTGGGRAPWLAAALFIAAFRHTGAWLDVARADSLALALVLGAFVTLRMRRHPLREGVIAGMLAGLAFLAKQTALVTILPAAIVLLALERRRGLAFACTAAAVIAGSTLVADAASGGWYRYYVFGLAAHSTADAALAAKFWTRDLGAPFALALLGGAYAAVAPAGETPRRDPLAWAAVAGLVASSWVVRAYPTTFDNVLMPAGAAAAILFGWGWDVVGRQAGTNRGRIALATAAGLLQFSLLAYDPRAQVPTRLDRAQGDRLVDGFHRAPGTLLVPCHEYLAVRAGKGTQFHEMAFMAVAKSGTDSTATRLLSQLREALAEHRSSTIAADKADCAPPS